MAKLEQERRTLWKDLNITKMILKEVLFLEPWKKYSDIFSPHQINTLPLWLEHLIFRSIMKTYLIY